jgi:ATP-binding cassette subfamily G (WHITE) protein 2 (SNQ2)
VYYREAAAKTYRQLPFALSMVLAEMPYSLLCAIGFFLPIYYIPGFQMASSRAGYTFFMILVTEVFSVTLAQMVSALTPSTFIAMLLNPPIIIIFALFCGVAVSVEQTSRQRSCHADIDPRSLSHRYRVSGVLGCTSLIRS